MLSDNLMLKLSEHLGIKPKKIALASEILLDEKLPNWT